MSVGKVAVFTASSNSGGACVSHLLTKYAGRVAVRAVFRTDDKAVELRASGVGSTALANETLEIVTGYDAYESEATLCGAFEGADVAVIVTPHDPTRGFADDSALTIKMINAAALSGVSRIVSVGSWTCNNPLDVPMLATRFIAPENELAAIATRHAEISWTSLRAGFFFGNLIPQFGSLRAGDALRYPEACAFAPVDPRDVGRCAAAVAADAISTPGTHASKCYEISGPQLMTAEEMAVVMAASLERPGITLSPLSVEDFATKLPPPLAQLMRYMNSAGPAAIPFEANQIAELIGEPATTLAEWATERKEAFAVVPLLARARETKLNAPANRVVM
eukprot:m.238770 g.238770  ORF g.238770 m.238770 type:complete len:336 (-) comp26242_c0_seq4:124-1131(-)